MSDCGRVTDVVEYFKAHEDMRSAVKTVRLRVPERFRWRRAVASVVASAGNLQGMDRLRIEEPVREVVVDLKDSALRREVVLDARRLGVDLDRGEVLPMRTLSDLRLAADLTGADLTLLHRYVPLPSDVKTQVDTAGIVVLGRALGEHYRARGLRLLLDLPESESDEPRKLHHAIMEERAGLHRAHAQRWFAFARHVVGEK